MKKNFILLKRCESAILVYEEKKNNKIIKTSRSKSIRSTLKQSQSKKHSHRFLFRFAEMIFNYCCFVTAYLNYLNETSSHNSIERENSNRMPPKMACVVLIYFLWRMVHRWIFSHSTLISWWTCLIVTVS